MKMTQLLHLEVHQIWDEDAYRNRARIRAVHRGTISEGKIVKFSVNNKSVLVEVRGNSREEGKIIRIDEITRVLLGVQDHTTYTFRARQVGWLGQFLWAWNASDSAARIAARLGLIGVILGVIGVVPLLKDLFRWISS
jgi:hypothetical protein